MEDLLSQIKDLQVRVRSLEDSIVVKRKPWTVEEVNSLVKLAQTMTLTKDKMRTRETIFLRLIQAHQQSYARTERAITMRLEKDYFK